MPAPTAAATQPGVKQTTTFVTAQLESEYGIDGCNLIPTRLECLLMRNAATCSVTVKMRGMYLCSN
jgi:hypothetical protein